MVIHLPMQQHCDDIFGSCVIPNLDFHAWEETFAIIMVHSLIQARLAQSFQWHFNLHNYLSSNRRMCECLLWSDLNVDTKRSSQWYTRGGGLANFRIPHALSQGCRERAGRVRAGVQAFDRRYVDQVMTRILETIAFFLLDVTFAAVMFQEATAALP